MLATTIDQLNQRLLTVESFDVKLKRFHFAYSKGKLTICDLNGFCDVKGRRKYALETVARLQNLGIPVKSVEFIQEQKGRFRYAADNHRLDIGEFTPAAKCGLCPSGTPTKPGP